MSNVYELIQAFYKDLPSDTMPVLSKESVERYLRKKAWKGMTDQEQKRCWSMLAVLLQLAAQSDVNSPEVLSVVDYQEIFFRFAQEEKEFSLDEESMVRFFQMLKDFFSDFEGEQAAVIQERLQEAQDSFYVLGEFALPTRKEGEDFYNDLEHRDVVTEEDQDRLNEILDRMMRDLGKFYHQTEFQDDMARAMALYTGPELDPEVDLKEKEREEFQFNFWDFFLFDYHLLDTDLTPLEYYYKHQQKKLGTTETHIIRDLLKAAFCVFSIESVGADSVICRDLFTGEQMELPMPEEFFVNIQKTLFIGHLHHDGVMMLNHVTAVPASRNLRKRIKTEVMRQFELFRYQQPEAELKDFFVREAAVVRQIIQIMTGYAQLNIVPMQSFPAPISRGEVPEEYRAARDSLRKLGKKIGFSVYGLKLLDKLYGDYIALSRETPDSKKSFLTQTVTIYMFGQVNGMDIAPAGLGIFSEAENETVDKIMAEMEDLLHCVILDPRYLTEEGFVQALFAE